MNNKLKNCLLKIVCILFYVGIANVISAQNKNATSFQTKEDVMHLDFDVNINVPTIKDKYKQLIIAHQKKTGEQFIKQGYKVETTRKGEVLIISIPAHELFAPNNLILKESATKWLSPILSLVKYRLYKLLIAMHSDDTGSDEYVDQLTNNRIISIYEWLKTNSQGGIIVPYAMGNSEPIKPNNSRLNRQANRRLEIYVVPSEQMIELAKSNNL